MLSGLGIACGQQAEPRQSGTPAGGTRLERSVPGLLEGTTQGDVAAGDIDAVRAMIDRGWAVDDRDEQGATLLHIAAIHGRLGVVRLLLERGASVEARDRSGLTPLHAVASMTHWMPPGRLHGMRLFPACGTEHRAVADLLIERGADIHARDGLQRTPLHWAAKGGNPEVALLLIERGADVNGTDEGGSTPLRLAAMGGNWEPNLPGFVVPGEHAAVAKMLLDHGADCNASSFMGTPLAEAIRSGASDVAEVLLEHGASAEPGEARSGLPPLHMAAFMGDTAVIESLLGGGANVDATDQVGRTPLFLGALAIRIEAVRLLLQHGAKVQTADRFGRTPLHAAATSGSVEILRAMVARGGDIMSRDKRDNTLLHAAAGGCLAGGPMVAYLVQQGLDINVRNSDGETPLHLAEQADCPSGARQIVAAIKDCGGTL
jgi:ankyrin repeat protein